MLIDITVHGQTLTASAPTLAAGSIGKLFCRLSLDDEWDGLNIKMLFRSVSAINVESRSILVDNFDKIGVPPEVICEGSLYISVCGTAADGTIRMTTATMTNPIYIFPSGILSAPVAGEITPNIADQLLSRIGILSDLDTEAKGSLVAAINELAQDGLIARLASSLTASDGPGVIDLGAPEASPFLRAVVPAISHLVSDEAIPNVGALRKVLDQLNEKIENGDKLPAFLQEFSEALAGFDDGDILGTPLRSPLSDSGWASLILELASSEAEDAASFRVPTMQRLREYAAPAALNWRDVSEDYAVWTKPENAETKSAKDYLWTLPDGAYRCGDSIGQHELKRLTSDGGVYRSYWEYHDGCAYFQMYIDEQEVLAYDGESGQILVNGLPIGKDIEIDKTLTQSDAAADAKAVGDAIDSLVESVNAVLRSIVRGDAE